MRVKAAYSDAVLIFIAPPSMSELKTRLIRAAAPERRSRRNAGLKPLIKNLDYVNKYDYVVVNDILDLAIARVEHILSAERLQEAVRNGEMIEKLMGGRSEL
jgi:guanylate kinase